MHFENCPPLPTLYNKGVTKEDIRTIRGLCPYILLCDSFVTALMYKVGKGMVIWVVSLYYT
jgi:hypothetical protein